MLASGVQETSGYINLGATLGPRAAVVRRRDVHQSLWHVPGILGARCRPQAYGVRPTSHEASASTNLWAHWKFTTQTSGDHECFCDSVLEREACEKSWPMVALVFCF